MKKIIFVFIAIAAVLCAKAGDFTEDRYKEARKLIKKGEYAAAEKILTELVTANPAYEEFRYRLGEVYMARNKLDEAEALYLGITVINPNSNEAYSALSRLYEKSGRLTDAAKSMEKAVRIMPDNASYKERLAALYERIGDKKRAEFYRQAAKPGANYENILWIRVAVWAIMGGVFVFFMFRNVNVAALFSIVSSAAMFLGKRNLEAFVFVFLGSAAMLIMWLKTKPSEKKRSEKKEGDAKITVKDYDEAVKKAYLILGLKQGATKSEIKSAYHKIAKKHHPDKTGGDKKGEELLKAANSAYELLRRKS